VHGTANPTDGLELVMERKERRSELVVKVVRDGEDGKKEEVVREVTWAFGDVYEAAEEKQVKVGVYAARPDPEKQGGEGLEVRFDGFGVEVLK